MYNPIIAHRQEVIDRIVKGFADDIDEIEKAQYVHKRRLLRYSKNGTWYYDYNDPKNKRLILGDDKLTERKLHITINSKMLLHYTDEMKDEVRQKLTSMGCTLLGQNKDWNKSKKGSYYLKFDNEGTKFKIRVSDHTKSTVDNGTVFVVFPRENIEELDDSRIRKRVTWYIDASLGRIQPKDIGKIVSRINSFWKKYNTKERFRELNEYVEKHKSELNNVDECDEEETIYQFAENYINENGIKDDGFCIAYQILYYLFGGIIRPIIDENNRD